ncbi:MAG: delta-60 repeat domain-containing protein [bacterium]
MKIFIIICIPIITLFISIFMYSCKSRGARFFGFNDNTNFSGYVHAVGKVSNTFGTPLGRDLDNDGDLDATVIFHNIAGGSRHEYGYSIYVHQNGKIYVTGESSNTSDQDLIVTRLNSNGSLDTTFGSGGHVVINNIVGNNSWEQGNSIYVDQAGKVYVTGESSSGLIIDLIVTKLNSDGSLDTTFGSGGHVILHNIAGGNWYDYGHSIYVDQAGKVYITGCSWNGSDEDLIVTRLNSNGTLDNTFGSSGHVILHNIAGGNSDDVGYSIYVDQSGKVYVTGYSYNVSDEDLIVTRLNSNGTLDNTFGSGGHVVLNNVAGGNWERGYSIYVDQNGKIYVTGQGWNSLDVDLIVTRLNSDGSLDTTFGSGGHVIVHNIAGGNWEEGRSIYLDQTGKVYVAGQARNVSDTDLAVTRLNSDGSLDTTFGSGGHVIVHNIAGGNSEEGNSIYVDQNGKIYVSGSSHNGSNYDLIVVKIE